MLADMADQFDITIDVPQRAAKGAHDPVMPTVVAAPVP